MNWQETKRTLRRMFYGLEAAKGHSIQYVWDIVVTFVVPAPLARFWMRWVFRPIRMNIWPWEEAVIDRVDCPFCEIAFLEGDHEVNTFCHHYGWDHPSLYDYEDEEGEW